MTFIVTLCMAHEDAVTILQQSHLLIPSVVAFLSHITTPLFEEEPELVNNAQQLEAYASPLPPAVIRLTLGCSTMMRSVRSVSVLYTLVRGADNSTFNLYNKLRRVSTRDIPSMFDVAVVTLARLTWADPPLEASDEAKTILEEGIGMQRTLCLTKLSLLLILSPPRNNEHPAGGHHRCAATGGRMAGLPGWGREDASQPEACRRPGAGRRARRRRSAPISRGLTPHDLF